ncbi:MAG: M20/M25/M40 family metallo-hydrolase [Chloroflexota bacterium]|nr:M20/M25/M40 family metallo-hydrolase [Chloroflexota bacterium]
MATEDLLRDAFAHVDAQREAFIQRLLDYVSQPSISAHGVGIMEVAQFLRERLNALGMEGRLIDTDGWPMVYGRRDNAPGAPTILLYGHYDVQPPDPLEEWVSPPFEPEIRNGRIYGRGVGDNKGQHFAQLLGIESLLAVSDRLPCNVIFLLEGEEEVGSPHIAQFVRQHADLLKADLVVTADGPVHDSGRATLNFGVRGVLSFELHARGANHDLHSGNWGGVAPNPIWTLIHALSTMKNDRGEVLIEGFYDDVLPPSELELQALAALPVDVDKVMRDLDLKKLDAPAERGFYERLSLWPTLTINGFHGGYGGPGSKTVLPHEAFVKCDIRLVEAQTIESISAKLEAHVARHAPDVKLVLQGGMDPSKTPLDSRFVAPIRQAIQNAQGEDPLFIPAMGGSLPDYVFTKLLGLPAFGTPYANPDEANHAPNENLEVERFIRGIKTGAALLANLGRMSGS